MLPLYPYIIDQFGESLLWVWNIYPVFIWNGLQVSDGQMHSTSALTRTQTSRDPKRLLLCCCLGSAKAYLRLCFAGGDSTTGLIAQNWLVGYERFQKNDQKLTANTRAQLSPNVFRFLKHRSLITGLKSVKTIKTLAIIKTQIKVLFKITYYSKYKKKEILLNLKHLLKVF